MATWPLPDPDRSEFIYVHSPNLTGLTSRHLHTRQFTDRCTALRSSKTLPSLFLSEHLEGVHHVS